MALRGTPEVLFSSVACFSFLAAGKKERELESLLKAVGEARRQQLWQRERERDLGEEEEEVEEEEE